MELSSTLLKNFAKSAKSQSDTASVESYAYGHVFIENDRLYVILDGSDVKTPVESIVETAHGDRVLVLFKNHSATITGNMSDPASSSVTEHAMESIGTRDPDLEDELLAFSESGKYALSISAIRDLIQLSQDYEPLLNKPSIEGVTLIGDKSFEDLNLQAMSNTELEQILQL